MKRYLLFAYKTNKHNGGWHDFVGAYETKSEAEVRAYDLCEMNNGVDWHLYDTQKCELVVCKEEFVKFYELRRKWSGR